jgi:OOP family OmpA-OmpF porin
MRALKRTGAAALLASLFTAGTAGAAEDGWYVVAFGGEAGTKNVEQGTLDQSIVDALGFVGLSVVDVSSSLDDSDSGFGFAGGYQVNENFAAELALVDLGEFSYSAEGTVTDGFSVFDTTFGLNQSATGAVFSVLGIWPVGERFAAFARVGLALMSVDAEASVSIDGTSAADSASTDRTNMMYGAGADLSLGHRLGLRLEWNRYAEVGSEDLLGDTDIDLVSLGLRYSFD